MKMILNTIWMKTRAYLLIAFLGIMGWLSIEHPIIEWGVILTGIAIFAGYDNLKDKKVCG